MWLQTYKKNGNHVKSKYNIFVIVHRTLMVNAKDMDVVIKVLQESKQISVLCELMTYIKNAQQNVNGDHHT